jgi:hypothetical protein
MQRVEERTIAFEQSRATQGQALRGPTSAPAKSTVPPEERLRKLDELHRKGLITKDEFNEKKAQILKEL